MTGLPKYFTWVDEAFVPIKPTAPAEILVADSWRVRNGQVWGLTDHVQRFLVGLVTQSPRATELPAINPVVFEEALHQQLEQVWQVNRQTDLFPRISVEAQEDSWRVILLIRPAPQVRESTSLWIPQYPDPRTRPSVKGPDISLLRTLVSDVATDDVVLHDGTSVHETTTGALLVWQTPDHLVFSHADQQLASISAQRIANHARSQNIVVTTRPVTLHEVASGEYPVWFSNTLHGISPVTTVGSTTGEQRVAVHPATAQWQAAWWTNFAV